MAGAQDSDAATDALLEAHLSSLPELAWIELEALVGELEANREPWAEWRSVETGGETRAGESSLRYLVYSGLAKRAMSELGRQGLRVVFDWPGWYQRSIYEQHPELIELASPTDAVRLLVRLVRGERFSEGAWFAALDDGTVALLFRRLLTHPR